MLNPKSYDGARVLKASDRPSQSHRKWWRSGEKLRADEQREQGEGMIQGRGKRGMSSKLSFIMFTNFFPFLLSLKATSYD